MIELRAGEARCIVSPGDGGRITSMRVRDRELLKQHTDGAHPMTWGSFAMVPWAGRVRFGSFRFDGNEYQLDLGLPPHAIHGTVYTQRWTVAEIGESWVAMSCPVGDHWPFGGVTHQRIDLFADGVRCELSVTADQLAMPAQVGWHPWFDKPDGAELHFARMYQRDHAGIPSGSLVEPPAGPWDDCFVEPLAPIELTYGDLAVTVTSDCDHWVIYDQPPEAPCVEPQSGPPDGLTLRPHRLEPGESLTRWMRIDWRREPSSSQG